MNTTNESKLDLNPRTLKKLLDNNMNVLISGGHGIGKTEIIKSLWESEGIKYRYFSAATMDPWVDFVGVPRVQTEEDGSQFLELVRPRDFANDEVEAIFFDELNRTSDKVVNAIMELMQFKSINGKKFKNLRVIWAAINPFEEDERYAVIKLDDAVKDRFHAFLEIKEKFISSKYFLKKYGDIADVFIRWWSNEDTYKFVSPRRLEYAINAYNNGIALELVLPFRSNIPDLKKRLKEFNSIKVEEITEEGQSFKFKAKGDYSIQELVQAVEDGEKAELNVKHSTELYDEIYNNHPVLLNYVHPEILNGYLTKTNAGNQYHGWKFVDNYNKSLNTNFAKLPDHTKKILAFHSRIPDKDSPFVDAEQKQIKTNSLIESVLSKIALD